MHDAFNPNLCHILIERHCLMGNNTTIFSEIIICYLAKLLYIYVLARKSASDIVHVYGGNNLACLIHKYT